MAFAIHHRVEEEHRVLNHSPVVLGQRIVKRDLKNPVSQPFRFEPYLKLRICGVSSTSLIFFLQIVEFSQALADAGSMTRSTG